MLFPLQIPASSGISIVTLSHLWAVLGAETSYTLVTSLTCWPSPPRPRPLWTLLHVSLKLEVCPGSHIFSIGLSRTPFGTHLQPQIGEHPQEMRLPGLHVWKNSRPAPWHHYFQGSSTLQRYWEAWKQQACIQPCWGNPFMQTYLLFSSLRTDSELFSLLSWIPFPSFHSKCQDASNPHKCLFLLFWCLVTSGNVFSSQAQHPFTLVPSLFSPKILIIA